MLKKNININSPLKKSALFGSVGYDHTTACFAVQEITLFLLSEAFSVVFFYFFIDSVIGKVVFFSTQSIDSFLVSQKTTTTKKSIYVILSQLLAYRNIGPKK